MIDIVPIKALSDNYIWLLTTNEGSILVDPGESKKIIDLIEDEAIDLKGILITHHHYDHTNGLNDILKIKQVDVYGPQNNISEINKIVKEGDKFSICGIQFEVIEVPGHTLDHIAFSSINSEKNILEHNIETPLDVKNFDKQIIGFSEKIKMENITLKRFLHKNLYQHPDVKIMTDRAVKVISDLFKAYLNDINLLPKEYLKYNLEKINNKSKERVVSDYIAGMTDRFALKEHKKLYGGN